MRVWFDVDNAPHVLIMRPLAQELVRRGHEVHFTARDRASTCELMDLYALPYTRVAGEFRAGKLGKASGTLGRAVQLAKAMRTWRADVSFGHGSRALPVASAFLRVPSATMYDYEWVNPVLFNLFCRTILLPAAIDRDRCREAHIRMSRVRHYPGYKEEIYLGDRPLDPGVAADLGLRPDMVAVLVRPPATRAHYHNPEAEAILDAILRLLCARKDIQLVWLGRGREQMQMIEGHRPVHLIVPDKVYDGPSLIACMDLVIGGGGTMTREAAVLGIPSVSFFRGNKGRVDESLAREGRLILVESRDAVHQALRLAKKPAQAMLPGRDDLVPLICDHIEAAARQP